MRGARLIKFQQVEDHLSTLIVGEWTKQLPFPPRRLIWLSNFTKHRRRKAKASHLGKQILVPLVGHFTAHVEYFKNGQSIKQRFQMWKPHLGLYVPNKCWRSLENFSPDAVVLVICSNLHDEFDWIRDYKEWEKEYGEVHQS